MKNWALYMAVAATAAGLLLSVQPARAQVDPNADQVDTGGADVGGGALVDPNAGANFGGGAQGGFAGGAAGGAAQAGGRGGRGGRGGAAGGAGGLGGGPGGQQQPGGRQQPQAQQLAAAGGGGFGGGGFGGGQGGFGGGQGGFGGGQGGFGGGRGGGGGGNSLQAVLASPDDEWAVISPRLQKVLTLMQQTSAATYGTANMQRGAAGGGGAGGRGGRGGQQTTGGSARNVGTDTAQTSLTLQDLYDTLNNPNASDDEIRAKLNAFRQAKQLVDSQLKQAQEELRAVLTLRQEAIMIGQGYLE